MSSEFMGEQGLVFVIEAGIGAAFGSDGDRH